MGDTIAQTRSENVSKFSNDPLLAGVNTPRSREDSLKLTELMELGTNLQQRVFDLETTKTSQAQEIKSLKKRVNRLEKKRRSRTHGLKILYKVRLSARVESSADEDSLDEDIFGVNDQDDTSVFDADKDLQGEKVVVEKAVAGKEVSAVEEVNASSITTPVSAAAATTTTATTTPTISMDEITLANALIETKTSMPKAKGIVVQKPSETPTSTPIASSQQPSKVQDKSKGIMVEEPLKMKKNDQILFDKEIARKLQEEIYEQERLLAERLQAEEQEQLTDAKKAKLFMEFIEKRRKFFAAKRDEEKRNKPPTKAQQRSLMCTYLKNLDEWKPRRRLQRKTRQRQYKKAVQREQEMNLIKKDLISRRLKPSLMLLKITTAIDHHGKRQIGGYELWRMRMEQYIQMVDYSLWEVIENGNTANIDNLSDAVICAFLAIQPSLGYNVVPPLYTGNFLSPKPNLSGLQDFKNESMVSETTDKKPVVETSKAKACEDKPKVVRNNCGPLIIEDWKSDDEDESVPQPKIEKKTIKPSFAKIEFVKSNKQVKSPKKTTVKQDEKPRQHTHKSRGNQRNRNNLMSQRLWSNFEMYNKACYECGMLNSGCLRHMIGNMSYLTDYEEIDRGYVAFGEKLWTTTKAKNINEEAQIHTKVDGKKVIVSEASIWRDLRFGNEGGIDCFSNKVIFEQRTFMGYEKLTQKLTFYKAFLLVALFPPSFY
nr:retrotransposon Orf1 [Tanacetum cinerariifolium]